MHRTERGGVAETKRRQMSMGLVAEVHWQGAAMGTPVQVGVARGRTMQARRCQSRVRRRKGMSKQGETTQGSLGMLE